MDESVKKLRMVYFEKPAPKILIYGSMDGEFFRMRDAFLLLSRSSVLNVALHRESFLMCLDETEVTLTSAGSMFDCGTRTPLGLRRIEGARKLQFRWARSSENWDYSSYLMDGLIDFHAPSHVVLTAFPADDAVIEVAKGVFDDNLIKSAASRSRNGTK